MSANSEDQKQNQGQLNSVQLNVVTFIDVAKAVANKSLDNTFYMMDNSVGGVGQGTDYLETICKQGQVINWIIYAMDSEKGIDGNWPPMPKINNIVFLNTEDGDLESVAETKICTEFKIYGMPDRMNSPFTPVYYYWAGTVLSSLKPGNYPYRFVLELEQEGKKEKLYLNSQTKPSLQVLAV